MLLALRCSQRLAISTAAGATLATLKTFFYMGLNKIKLENVDTVENEYANVKLKRL
jgi:hypothetical protein